MDSKLEYKIFSKVHPDYFFLVVKSGENLLIDTNLLQKTLTNKDKKNVQNHENVDELLFKLKDRNLNYHPYQQWLSIFLSYAKRVEKDFEIIDDIYWNEQNRSFKFLGQKKVENNLPYEEIKVDTEMSGTFISLDVETTGLNPEIHSIIQLSAVKYENFEKVAEFDTFVAPSNDKIISEEITELTGIKPSDLEDAPHFSEAWDKFKEFFNGEQLVGQNLIFDLRMLSSECNRAEKEFGEYTYADTLTMTKRKFPHLGRGNYKLEVLKKKFLPEDIAALDSHNSLNDCIIAGELYKFLLKEAK